MSLLRFDEVKNGDYSMEIPIYLCNKCSVEIHDSYPKTEFENDVHYCWKCSFLEGFINEREFLKFTGCSLPDAHASIRNGKVVLWIGKRPPWERSVQDIRNSAEYAEWRRRVYERDNYTCQHCGQVGGELNAHHIKPFAKYEKLMVTLSNGLTLCVECHREEHRRKDAPPSER